VLPGRWAAAAGGGDLDDEGAAMKIRFLPRWPPRWTSASGGSHPGERAGVLQSVEWRVDLQRERNLVIVLMYNGRKFDVQDGIGHRSRSQREGWSGWLIAARPRRSDGPKNPEKRQSAVWSHTPGLWPITQSGKLGGYSQVSIVYARPISAKFRGICADVNEVIHRLCGSGG
jgi:hypothetical protein